MENSLMKALKSGENITHFEADEATDTFEILPHMECVFLSVTTDSLATDFSVQLPPAAKCPGQFISFEILDIGTDSEATVVDSDGSTAVLDSFDAANDNALFFSNGVRWVIPYNGIA